MPRIRVAALLSSIAVGSLLLVAACRSVEPAGTPEMEPRLPASEAEAWARTTLEALSLEERVSQLFSAQARGQFYSADDPEYVRLVDLVENFGIGGIIFSIGQPIAQAELTNDLQGRSSLPLLISIDGEWGMGMRLERTTTFPRAMALGATGDPNLAYRMGRAVAEEARALGVHQNYAPVADINNDPGNPVINVRSFGGSSQLVSAMSSAYARGMEDGNLLSTLKHFPGHGDTSVDSHLDLPVLPFGRDRLDSLELVPFRNAIEKGVSSIMIAHLAFPAIEPDPKVPATLSARVVTDILRRDLGYDGLVVTDAMNMQGVTKHFGAGEAAVRALEAGIDQILMSEDAYAARSALLDAVERGRLTEDQVNQAAFRVLRAKAMLNTHRNRFVDTADLKNRIATAKHLALRNEIARRSLTLLRNDGSVLPILTGSTSILAITLSDDADPGTGSEFLAALRANAYGNKIDHVLLDRRSDEKDYDRVLAEAPAYDLVLVPTYLRVRSWSGEIALPEQYRDFLNGLIRGPRPVVLLSFGNPYMVIGLEPPAVYVSAYGASESTVVATAEAVFGRAGFSGKLPVEIPEVHALGDGIELPQTSIRRALPEEVGMRSEGMKRIDSLLGAAIRSHAFPGAALSIGRSGSVVKLDAYGYQAYRSDRRVTTRSMFDLASLTKVVATTTAVMKLYDEGRIDLEAPVAQYVPEFGANGKESVTVRHLLTHTSGLPAFRRFDNEGLTTREAVMEAILGESLQFEPGTFYRYSDFGMIVMAEAVSRIAGMPFDAYVRSAVFEPLEMSRTGFRPIGAEDNGDFIPTEVDETFRRKLIQGEVHDETAWILGGTAGHAGLFSCAEDLTNFVQMLLSGGRFRGKTFLKEETVRLFTSRVPNEINHTRALGWDTRSDDPTNSAGGKLGPRSFGHTGFTGTSIWVDPDADLFVILLSNRVHPTRQNMRIGPVRALLSDLAFDALDPDALPAPVSAPVAR